MPTAARLVAALLLAALAWFVSSLIKPLLPSGTDFGWFSELNLALGLLIGWNIIGARAGRGLGPAIGHGLTAGAVLVFWGLFLQSAYKMIEIAMRGRYDDALEATAAVFEIMFEYGALIATPQVIAALVLGASATGCLAELVHKVTQYKPRRL